LGVVVNRKIFGILCCLVLLISGFQVVSGINVTLEKNIQNVNNAGTKYCALLIAVGEYLNHPEQNRHHMQIEVENLYETLLESEHWHENNIKKIKGAEATLEGMLAGLKWLDDQDDSDDVSLVYITTHGFPLHINNNPLDIPPLDEEDGSDEALVPYEGFENTNKFLWDDLLNVYLSALESRALCVIIESCYSGGFNDPPRTKRSKNYIESYSSVDFQNGFIEELGDSGRVVLMSSEECELSYGCIFSRYLSEGLRGNADENDDGIVTAEEAFYYSKAIVDVVGSQHPSILDLYEGELPITGSINGGYQAESKILKFIQASSIFSRLYNLFQKFLIIGRTTGS
jgi:hypothetical protein